VSRSFEIIHFKAVAAILCLVPGHRFFGLSRFLEQCIQAWQELPVFARYWPSKFASPASAWSSSESYRERLYYYTLVHHLRSFTPANSRADQEQPAAGDAGLKCARDWVTIASLYGETATKLVERPYSVAVSVFPRQRQCGHYVLASIVDPSLDGMPFDPGVFDEINGMPRETFGIQPAGLYNGVSVFQIQLCALITAWKVDWISTIDEVDKMVSVTVRCYGPSSYQCRC
jgi:hypothetical protein